MNYIVRKRSGIDKVTPNWTLRGDLRLIIIIERSPKWKKSDPGYIILRRSDYLKREKVGLKEPRTICSCRGVLYIEVERLNKLLASRLPDRN